MSEPENGLGTRAHLVTDGGKNYPGRVHLPESDRRGSFRTGVEIPETPLPSKGVLHIDGRNEPLRIKEFVPCTGIPVSPTGVLYHFELDNS